MTLNLCSCIGCVGEDPYCPCEMKNRGLTPTPVWTPEKIAEFKSVLGEMFDWKENERPNQEDH